MPKSSIDCDPCSAAQTEPGTSFSREAPMSHDGSWVPVIVVAVVTEGDSKLPLATSEVDDAAAPITKRVVSVSAHAATTATTIPGRARSDLPPRVTRPTKPQPFIIRRRTRCTLRTDQALVNDRDPVLPRSVSAHIEREPDHRHDVDAPSLLRQLLCLVAEQRTGRREVGVD